MKIEDKLLTPNKYSRPCTKMGTVKNIVIHWVGNAGSKAISNRNYFESLKDKKIYASSHYIIGLEGEIIRCVPENEVAYHGNSANSYSIGIENCHPDWEGKFNDKTYKSLIELCADLCKRYCLNPETALIRHYDVTRKDCPHYYVQNPKAWEQLKSDVKNAMKEDDEVVKKVRMQINGVIKEVNAINKDGNNFVKLQDIKDHYIDVTYDSIKKIPVVEARA
nr:MAG TPA: N-acetylmuramoyl-L-alanine amidase [Caudoviricetes sp.]